MIDWHLYFVYRAGCLLWKWRTDFDTPTECRRWNSRYAATEAGTIFSPRSSVTQYRRVRLAGKHYLVHQIIWQMLRGKIPAGAEIDHRDGNGLNNRIGNLRLVRGAANARNKPLYRNNKSGTPGVTWDRKSKAWRARISINCERINLGLYESVDDARAVRKDAERGAGYHVNHGRRA